MPNLPLEAEPVGQGRAVSTPGLSAPGLSAVLWDMDGTLVDSEKIWDVALLFSCFIASIVPVWILLQPRGHLGGYFLYVALAGGALGLLFGAQAIQFPAFRGWTTPKGETLFPVLFITIACGSISAKSERTLIRTACGRPRTLWILNRPVCLRIRAACCGMRLRF